jgi:hypothetical protein
MPTLETVANYAEIIGAIAVLFAIGFAVLEFRQIRHQRTENASLELMRAWQGPEYVDAIYEILRLEDHIDPEALGEAGEMLAFRVGMTFEALGLMAHRGTIPIDILSDLMGGVVAASWRKLDQWVYQERTRRNPRAWEWFEWLVRQLQEMPAPDLDESS